jgi:hypothetical protein
VARTSLSYGDCPRFDIVVLLDFWFCDVAATKMIHLDLESGTPTVLMSQGLVQRNGIQPCLTSFAEPPGSEQRTADVLTALKYNTSVLQQRDTTRA